MFAAVGAALAGLAAGATAAGRTHSVACPARHASAGYTASVRAAVSSKHDLWGGQLLRARGGPTYAAARRFLAPLTEGMQWEGRPLATSGSYYLPLSFPFTPYGSTVFALHVADGSQIITRRIGGASVSFYVGNGRELYGSCRPRLQPARLAGGYMPVLQTPYTPAAGGRYPEGAVFGPRGGAGSGR